VRAQAVEHYEISRYGTLIAWADQLGMRDVSRLLKQIWRIYLAGSLSDRFAGKGSGF
jgi:hypothetical protein